MIYLFLESCSVIFYMYFTPQLIGRVRDGQTYTNLSWYSGFPDIKLWIRCLTLNHEDAKAEVEMCSVFAARA
jgi:hypothetical protein